MRDWRFRQNAVAKIEDKGPGRESLKRGIHRAIERCTAGEKRQRINIALHWNAALDLFAREVAIDHPVEPDAIDRHLVDIAQKVGSGSAREADDFCIRHRMSDLRDDFLRRLN